MSRRLLLLSNSMNFGQGYLEHALPVVRSFLGAGVRTVAFVPYAGVTVSWDDYTDTVRERFESIGYGIESVHGAASAEDVVRSADAVAVGGGNTFRLLERLYSVGLVDVLRSEALGGKPFIGWSAGSNVACPTIRTTNDMPIIEPPSLNALGLIPFQINPHYLDAHPDKHQGETREQRLQEFAALNPDVYVAGLREGSILRIEGDEIKLIGDKTMRLFRGTSPATETGSSPPLRFLLNG